MQRPYTYKHINKTKFTLSDPVFSRLIGVLYASRVLGISSCVVAITFAYEQRYKKSKLFNVPFTADRITKAKKYHNTAGYLANVYKAVQLAGERRGR